MISKISLINQHLQTLSLIKDIRGINDYVNSAIDGTINLLRELDENALLNVFFDYNKDRGCIVMLYRTLTEVEIYTANNYRYNGKGYKYIEKLLMDLPPSLLP